MPQPSYGEIQYQGKTYFDLYTLTARLSEIYPLSIHTLRRYAKQGKIPYTRNGANNKLWFDIDEVNKALDKLFRQNYGALMVDDNDNEDYLDGL